MAPSIGHLTPRRRRVMQESLWGGRVSFWRLVSARSRRRSTGRASPGWRKAVKIGAAESAERPLVVPARHQFHGKRPLGGGREAVFRESKLIETATKRPRSIVADSDQDHAALPSRPRSPLVERSLRRRTPLKSGPLTSGSRQTSSALVSISHQMLLWRRQGTGPTWMARRHRRLETMVDVAARLSSATGGSVS